MAENECTNASLPRSGSNEFTTIDLQESDDLPSYDMLNNSSLRDDYKSEITNEKNKFDYLKSPTDQSVAENSNQNSSSAENQLSTNTQNSNISSSTTDNQELPISDFSSTNYLNIINNNNNNSPSSPENNSNTTTPALPLHYLKPGISSAIFSFIMTAAFVCILWLVVFMIFGYKGHAIAGVFIGLFLVGLLINTCFLKLYFRLKVFLGLSAALAAAERQSAALQRQRELQTQQANEKALEMPPSYASVVESPPPYSFLQYYKSKKSSLSVNSAPANDTPSPISQKHNCPFCKREVQIFGICISCQSNLSNK